MSLFKKFATVGGATMASRLLGFTREMMMAAALGAGAMSDAFFAAFRFPNLFRRLFAEGAFNAAFVPLFAREIEENGVEGAKRFSEEVLSVLFTTLLLVTFLMELAMPFLVRYIIAPGFADDADKFQTTVWLSVIMFPYLMCMSLTAMMSGILNSMQRYFVAAIAPVFLNVILIAVLVYVLWFGESEYFAAESLAWGVLVAGVLQLAVVLIGVRHAGIKVGFRRPRMTPSVKRLLWLAFPAAITGGITQINLVIGQAIASTKDGAISILQFADRIYQLPLGVVGIAVSVVLLPELARALKSGNDAEAGVVQNRSVEFALFLTLPAAAALLVMSEEIARVLYERGAFTPDDTLRVAGALAVFGIGLPAFVLIKAFTPGYFAREDTKTPMRFAGISIVVNIALALTLFPRLGEAGIATAEACAGWVNASLLLFVLVKRGHWQSDAMLKRRVPRMLLSAAIMAAALYGGLLLVGDWLATGSPVYHKVMALGGLIGVSMVVYFGSALLTGAADVSMLKRNLKRKRAAAASKPGDGAA